MFLRISCKFRKMPNVCNSFELAFLILVKLNHHRLKPVGSKEPICGVLESAKADSPLWGNMEITVSLLEVLGRNVFHDNLIGDIARGGCKVAPAPYVAAPELF